MSNIKDLKTVRFLASPYLNWKRKKAHEQYLLTPDHFYLKTLRGIHKGERCFIIGNGPSLRAADLNKLRGEVTFAANRIYEMFEQTDWRPTYYLAVDDRFLVESQNELAQYELSHMFLRFGVCTIRGTLSKLTRIYDRPMYFNIEHDRYGIIPAYISEDISDHFCDSGTVTFHAIQLAIYMGFKQIYLTGVDHNYSTTVDTSGTIHVDASVKDHFYSGVHNFYPASIDNQQNGYCVAREYCDRHNIAIYNATRGGKLEVFERVDLDEIIGGGKKINLKISSSLTCSCFARCAESEAA